MRTLISVLVLAVIVAGGFWLFNRNDADVALDPNGANTAGENFTGIGGPEDGFDPLDGSSDDEFDAEGKG